MRRAVEKRRSKATLRTQRWPRRLVGVHRIGSLRWRRRRIRRFLHVRRREFALPERQDSSMLLISFERAWTRYISTPRLLAVARARIPGRTFLLTQYLDQLQSEPG